MEYRQLGRTSLSVSIIGFGASPFGDVFGRTTPAESASAVNTALDRGINFFDVSPYYGLTLAESRLGDALHGHRDEVVLATKCGRYGTDEFDFSAARITAGLEASLKRLHTDRVDLLQAHDVEFAHVDQIVNETLPAMRRLQEQGKTRYVGITGYSLKNLTEIVEQVPVDSLITYCRSNLLIDDLDQKLLPSASKAGVGVIHASALHMGVLTERGAPAWHPAPATVLEAGRQMAACCQRWGVDISEVALHECVRHPGVASTLVGIANAEQVEASLRAIDLRVEPQLLEQLRAIAAPVYGITWPSGLPENYG